MYELRVHLVEKEVHNIFGQIEENKDWTTKICSLMWMIDMFQWLRKKLSTS